MMVIKMLINVRKTMHKQSENLRKYQVEFIELKNIPTDPENTIEGFNRILCEVEERTSELQGSRMHPIRAEKIKRVRIA